MIKIMCYSYKGGSGRTVASANLAAALAKNGKRVLIIDMDIEAPGLHTLFNTTNTIKYRNQNGIQNYLKGDLDLEEVQDEIIFDLGTYDDGFLTPLPIEDGGKLFYLMATSRTTSIFDDEVNERVKMEELLEKLNEDLELDYVILDSASGVRQTFTLSLGVSDYVLIFFRLTTQHFDGALKVGKLINGLKKMDSRYTVDFRMVASAVPREEEILTIENKTFAQSLANLLEERKTVLEKEFGSTQGKTIGEIPEITELKWQESIIVFDEDFTPYEQLAINVMRKLNKKA